MKLTEAYIKFYQILSEELRYNNMTLRITQLSN
jgi:hypothetical protein